MSQPVKNGASSDVLSTSPGPSQVTFELSAQDMASIDADIASNQDLLNNHAQVCCRVGLQMFTKARGQSDMSYVDIMARDTMQSVDARLDKSLNLDSKSSLLSLALDSNQEQIDSIFDKLDATKEGSIQQSVTAAVAEVVGEDGGLATTVRDVVDSVLEAELNPLKEAIERVDTYIKTKDGAEKVEANTPIKGALHELGTYRAAKLWAEAHGGIAIHTGTDNEPGDTVVKVPMLPGDDMKICVESKNESTPRGTKWISDKLTISMDHRDCQTGLWITKTTHGLSEKQIGDWALSSNSKGPWLATTIDNIETALTRLWSEEAIRRSKAADISTKLDAKGLRALREKAETIDTLMGGIQNINTEAGKVVTGGNKIRDLATPLRTNVKNLVAEIQLIIKIAMSGGGAA